MSDDSPESLNDDPTCVGKGRQREDQSLGDQSTYAGSNESSLSDLDGLGGSLADNLDGLEIVDLESRYTIIRPIGKGGMGEVFLATDTRLNRKVAIKRIKDELTTPAAAARFLTEAKSIAALSHPYIVQVYDYGRAKDGPFLIMEYVEGENLQQVCNQGVMALEDAIDLSCKLCDALSAAHSQGIIHRDIKPANILMTSGGWPKISDFGLAKSTNDHGHTMTGTALGTLDFMPPEQRRDASAVDHRSDLWSLAATIYQMVTGEPPKVIDLEDVPGALRSVLAKALKTKPESRYQSAVELGTALAEGMAAPEQPVVIPMAELGAGECPKCHVKNESSRKFCSGCGESLRLTCMKCELDIPVWENFCGECGGNQPDLLATRVAELEYTRVEAEQFRSAQQYEVSIQLAQQLAAIEDDRLLEHKSWADDFLRSTEELWEREKQSAQRHFEESKKHRRVFDFSAAIKAIEAIPEPLRSAEIKSHLLAVESEKAELIKLMPIIKKRVKNRETDGLLELVDRAIELRGESGNLAKLQQQLTQRAERKLAEREQEERLVCAIAQCKQGLAYAYGNGVAQSYKEAVKCFRFSAEHGLAEAQNNLGMCYANGNGVAQSYKEAVKWFRLSAKQGNAEAQNNLGMCYANGNGVAQSYKEAVKWFRLSAKQGNAEGKKALAEAKKRLEIAKGCPSCGFNYSWNGMFCTHCKYQK